MKKLLVAGAVGAVLAGTGLALSQTISVPTPSIISNGDLVPVVQGGVPSAQTKYASALQLAGYNSSLPWKRNALVGGDATTNLWQRATSGSSVTTAVTYGGPDRWAYWSGTSTAMKLIRSSAASDIPSANFQYAIKMQRTASQTGVVQMCMLQEVESTIAYEYQGQTAELDFHAATGADFSAASANMTAYIITGTGTDEGVAGSASVANGLNTGGGGSGSWTGQANATAAVISLGGKSVAGRYTAVAAIPTTATELAVALCYTPVGTAGTNDYVAFSGIQLVRNPSLASVASATVGNPCSSNTGGNGSSSTGVQCSAFDRTRTPAQEAQLQYRYFWQLNEPAGSIMVGNGSAVTTGYCQIGIPTPTTMRVAPTLAFGTLSNQTWATISGSATPIVLATTYLVQSALGANTPNLLAIKATGATTPYTAGNGCQLVGAGGSSSIQASAEL